MKRFIRLSTAAVFAFALAAAVTARAGDGQWTVVEDDDWCDDDSRYTRYCEIREIELDSRDELSVDGGKNGGIRVTGWDKNKILVQAKIRMWDVDREDAEEIADDIEISTDGEIRAEGPRSGWSTKWSVSFRIMVPQNTDLVLDANNGGIRIEDVEGDLDFSTRNGGIRLANVAGDVVGRTKNGGISVDLEGSAWNGDGGLDLETTNGGINLSVPEDYDADLEIATRNGGISADIPIRLSGRQSKRIRTALNDGGALIRLVTTNGGIKIRET